MKDAPDSLVLAPDVLPIRPQGAAPAALRCLLCFETEQGRLRLVATGPDAEAWPGVLRADAERGQLVASQVPVDPSTRSWKSLRREMASGAVAPGVVSSRNETLHAAEEAGLRPLPVREGEDEFLGWPGLPLRVAMTLFSGSAMHLERGLSSWLDWTQAVEATQLEQRAGGALAGRGRRWVSIEHESLGSLSGVHVPVPVSLEVELGEDGRPLQVVVGDPGPEAREEALFTLRRLQQSNRIAQEGGTAGTHEVTRDPRGRRRLVRRRISAAQ